MSRPALAHSHIGVTVPDLDAAVAWYTDTLGMYLIAGPITVTEDDTPFGRAGAEIFRNGYRSFSFAHLTGADGMGVELFSFENPAVVQPADSFEFWRVGIFHVGFTAPDMDETIERIRAAGGRIRTSKIVLDADAGYAICYCEDPWGTVIELCSHPYAQMYA